MTLKQIFISFIKECWVTTKKIHFSTWVLFILLLSIAYSNSKEWDTTDNPMTKERSGLSLYTDHLTGCQYLKAGYFGGMTPRLDKNRQPICEIK